MADEQGTAAMVADAPVRGPRFDRDVPPGGYLWWYLDGLSDDRRCAVTVIAFVGSVFSPYYAWSGRGDPLNHCAVNVAIYGDFGARWAMTERGRAAVVRTEDRFDVGPSALRWDDDTLVISVDEWCVPVPRRIRGTIRVTPQARPRRMFVLDGAGRHLWQPIAPKSRISVTLDQPDTRWEGEAYLDSNFGTEPLEDGFRDWTWSRAHLRGSSVVLYDAARRDGTNASLALRFGDDGMVATVASPPVAVLAPSGWRVARHTRADKDARPAVSQTLVDAPFYARSILKTRLYGESVDAVHESLLLDRFRSKIVQVLLPFRMPRRAG